MSENTFRALDQTIQLQEERLQAEVQAVVSAAVAMTEKGVMAASERVRAINEEARQQVGELQAGAERSFEGRQLATQLIETQTKFSTDTVSRLRKQHSAAQQSLALVHDIRKLATGINQISDAARMLTINGHIEAARLGAEGAGFRVIATELRELSRAVRTTNESITEITAGLVDLLPCIASEAASLLASTEQFSVQQVSCVSAFDRAVDESQRAMQGVAGSAKEWAERVLRHSSSLLADLSFQDFLAQDLGDVAALLRHSAAVIHQLIDAAEAGDGELGAGRIDEIRAAVPLKGRRIGQQPGEVRDRAENAGRPMLF